MIIISKYLVPYGYTGLTLFPFMFIKNKEMRKDKSLIYHEKIHLRQQLELLIFPFYVWYIVEFIIRLLVLRNWRSAYLNISFEREAYQNQFNSEYLKERGFWHFIKYICE